MNYPNIITGVSQGMFSIARYYGGVNLNGKEYVYFPDRDELVLRSHIKEYKAKYYPNKGKVKTKKVNQSGNLFE